LAEDFLNDQKQIWTSPAKLRLADSQWLVPLGGLTAAFFATDATVSRHLSHLPSTTNHYGTVSNASLGVLIGGAAGMWVAGHAHHNAHWVETGFLAGEATINSFVVAETLKYSLGRQRPEQGGSNGSFFQGGASFPSEHATAAWATAGVIAHEYPGPLTKIAVYGLAAFIDYSRVHARQHFPSDVFAGSLIGDFVGQDIYERYHDPELGGEAWRPFSSIVRELGGSRPSIPASPFVPLDSWIYPAIQRLAAMDYIDSMFLGSRPWTRVECARLVQQAGERLGGVDSGLARSQPERLYQTLYTEFQPEMKALENGTENIARIESLYTQSTEIVGEPLNDSYHFGQTIINNFGRTYQQGFNTYDGFSAWAADGRYAIYVRGEYQHAAAAPGFAQPIENLFSSLDIGNPVLPATPVPATNQFTLLDTYVSTALGGWNLSFGKQSLWWGQDEGGALLLSDNAAPIYMFRGSRTVPFTLPWFFHYLGAMKIDAFIGKLSGNTFPARPILHGEKISFKPTKNFEFAVTRLAEMGGAAVTGVNAVPNSFVLCPFGLQRAITPAALINSYFSVRESNFYACNANPGKRTAGFEFSYRLPFLRNWVTLYTDSLSPDDPSPLAAPRRAAVEPGIYISHFPFLSKLDLHVEAANTNTPSSSSHGQFVYIDNFYHDLSTNEGYLIGSWIGREGLGLQAWSNYWFSSRANLQFGYRHATVAADLIPGGESLSDASASSNFWIHNDVQVSLSVQYERWLAPVLSPNAQTNWTSSIGVTFQPRHWAAPFHTATDKDGTP
jgi:membrane-associated phospholipid phosphatase